MVEVLLWLAEADRRAAAMILLEATQSTFP
jgi:hypothetical protein